MGRSKALSKFNALTLQFTGVESVLEKDFKEKYFTTYKVQLRIAMWALILFYMVFSLLDHRIDPNNFWGFFCIRFFIVVPFSILFVIATFQKWFIKLSQPITSLLLILGASGIIHMVLKGNEVIQNYYSSGLFLVLLSLFAFLHVRFIWATATALIIIGEYFTAVYLSFHTINQNMVMIGIFLATFAILGSFVSYQMEILARKNYLLKQNIITEKKTLKSKVTTRTKELNESHQFLINEIQERQQLELKIQHIQRLESLALLAGGVAHDFNNLLTGIKGSIELSRLQLTKTSKFHSNLDIIEREANKAADLTQRLLAFSRQQDMNVEELNPNKLITNLTKMLQRLIGEHIKFHLDLSANIEMIYADKHQLEQVITNLSINARDAMQSGGILTISTRNNTNDQTVIISVSDTGTGMDEETLGKIFDPFFTTKELSSGTGLGLATSFGIIKQLDGKLTATSSAGHGSNFFIELPCADKENSHES